MLLREGRWRAPRLAVWKDKPVQDEFVRTEAEGAVATIRLDRPPANALGRPVSLELQGAARGGGAGEVALACGFRIAAEDAKLGLPEIHLGIIPGAGGTQRLPRLIGLARARELIYTGRHVGAAEALAIGLVDRVVAGGQGYAAALAGA